MNDDGQQPPASGTISATKAELDEEDVNSVLEFPTAAQNKTKRRHKVLGWVISLLVLLMVVAGVVIYFSPLLAVQQVNVNGTHLVPSERAEEKLQSLEGTPLPQVGSGQAMDLLEDEPAVESVVTHAEPPHTVSIEISEYEPVALAPQKGSDETTYKVFSAEGETLATVSESKAEELELPSLSSSQDAEDEDLFTTITQVLGSLPDDISQQVDSATGDSVDSIELSLDDGKTVVWGNAQYSERKAEVLLALLDNQEKVDEIDVSTPNQPVTR